MKGEKTTDKRRKLECLFYRDGQQLLLGLVSRTFSRRFAKGRKITCAELKFKFIHKKLMLSLFGLPEKAY